jgi:putative ABC transport system permease protein
MSLIKHYFKTLIRAFRRDLFYSLINLFGLAIGLASAFLILIYVQDELSYDKHFKDYERIYRLESYFDIKGKPDEFAITQIPLGPTLKDEYPEIEEVCRFLSPGSIIFEHKEEKIQEDSIMIVDTTLFSFLNHEILYGDPDKCLLEPYSMAVSESMANRYFGRTNVIGENLETNDNKLMTITAVFRDIPANTHMRYNGVFSAKTIEHEIGSERFNDRSAGSFWNIQVYTLVKMKENTDIGSVIEKFPEFYDKYMKTVGDAIDGNFELRATPISEVHYHPKKLQYDLATGEHKYLYILISVAIFIIIIAAINYMNLSTARSAKRAREVGMRKVTGAHKSLLIRQFLGESLILSIVAMILAILIIIALLPSFNVIAGKYFRLLDLFNPVFILYFIGITVLVGLLSGLYPSFYMSSFNPVRILKGGAMNGKSGAGLRTVLVIFQFMISAGLIIGSLAVANQLRFMQNKELGYSHENLLFMPIPDSTIKKNLEAFKQELEKSPLISGAAAFSGGPGSLVSKNVMRIEGNGGELEDHAINNFVVDYDYLDLMDLKIDTGRYYQESMGSDISKAFVINKTAAKEFNWHEDALGKRFQFGINLEGPPVRDGEIIGVLEDFNFSSLHNPIDPVVLILSDDSRFFQMVGVRYQEGRESEAIDWVKNVRADFNAYYPFDYFFVDEKLKESYKEEKTISKIFAIFTILTLFVAALGLLGLSAFITQQRTKEIGIRKVVGSSQQQIILLFMKKFLIWVVVANLIAFPVAYYLIDNWLQEFYYRIDFNYFLFLWSLFISGLVAMLTVSYQSWKASRIQPAKSLKYE